MGTEGYVRIHAPWWRPQSMTIYRPEKRARPSKPRSPATASTTRPPRSCGASRRQDWERCYAAGRDDLRYEDDGRHKSGVGAQVPGEEVVS